MTKSEQALRLIIQEGITATEAADRVGISMAAVSKAKLHPSKTAQNIRKLCEMQGEIEKLTAQRDTLLAAYKQTSSIGRFCLSEDECIVAGIDFSAYERGLSDAIEAFGKLFSAAIASVKGGAA